MNYATLPLSGGLIGIERETLRTTADVQLARTAHPQTLGSSFTHPHITIDYGEALLELVTSARPNIHAAYAELLDLTRFTAQHIGGERLWPVSMPCILPEDDTDIALGYFGESNSGKIKRLYREGLSHRYGRPMQMIAGIHFNYSPPPALFDALAELDGSSNTIHYRNHRYMGMLRTLQRLAWLICYLYGASPAAHTSFKPGRNVLHPLGDNTHGWRYATTLRMSSLGYQNKTDFTVSYNDLDSYTSDLTAAVLTPAPAFEYLGLTYPDGRYKQISTHILQIENEYYTAARPKQLMQRGELPVVALSERGIAYVELRLLDVNPYDPCGISVAQMHVLETLLLFALLQPSPTFTHRDFNEMNSNRLRAACCGLTPGLQLADQGKNRPAQEWAHAILLALQPLAENLSAAHQEHLNALITALEQGHIPLAHRVQQELGSQNYLDWGIALAEKHRPTLLAPLSLQSQNRLDALRDESLQRFADIEASIPGQIPFADYLAHYFDPLKALHERQLAAQNA